MGSCASRAWGKDLNSGNLFGRRFQDRRSREGQTGEREKQTESVIEITAGSNCNASVGTSENIQGASGISARGWRLSCPTQIAGYPQGISTPSSSAALPSKPSRCSFKTALTNKSEGHLPPSWCKAVRTRLQLLLKPQGSWGDVTGTQKHFLHMPNLVSAGLLSSLQLWGLPSLFFLPLSREEFHLPC